MLHNWYPEIRSQVHLCNAELAFYLFNNNQFMTYLNRAPHSLFDLSKRLVLAPVVLNHHWSLLAIFNPSNVSGKNNQARPVFFHLDSLPGIHKTSDVCAAVESTLWLQHYHHHHPLKEEKLSPTELHNQLNAYLDDKSKPSQYISYNIPMQKNGYDCAIYTLACIDEIMFRWTTISTVHQKFDAEVLPQIGNFSQADITEFRKNIQKLILGYVVWSSLLY